MNLLEIEEKIRAVMAKQFSVAADQITSETLLEDDLGADSMGLVELMVNLEEAFDMQMPDIASPDVQAIQSVGDIVDFIAGNSAVEAGAAQSSEVS